MSKCDSINLWLEHNAYDIVTINETWLTPDIPTTHLDIKGYDIICHDRTTGKRGGGLLTLLRQDRNISYCDTKFTPQNTCTNDIELLITELKIGHVKKMIVINCYRPPSGNVANCLDQIENVLDNIHKVEEYELYINGDMNIAYNSPDSPDLKKLKIFERKYNLTQLIKTPTRCTAKTRNILDPMLTNSKFILSSGSDDINISDHQPVWLIRKKQPTQTSYVDFECRCFRNYDKTDYQNDLLSQDWTGYYSETCPNTLWDSI